MRQADPCCLSLSNREKKCLWCPCCKERWFMCKFSFGLYMLGLWRVHRRIKTLRVRAQTDRFLLYSCHRLSDMLWFLSLFICGFPCKISANTGNACIRYRTCPCFVLSAHVLTPEECFLFSWSWNFKYLFCFCHQCLSSSVSLHLILLALSFFQTWSLSRFVGNCRYHLHNIPY